jgi:hypothetical protein
VWKVDPEIGTQLKELRGLKEKARNSEIQTWKEVQELQAIATAKESELKLLKEAKEDAEREMVVLREVNERGIRELKEKNARETQELLRALHGLRALNEVKEKEIKDLRARGVYEDQDVSKELGILPGGEEAENVKRAVFDRANGVWRGVNTKGRENRE